MAALHACVLQNNTDGLRLLLLQKDVDINSKADISTSSPQYVSLSLNSTVYTNQARGLTPLLLATLSKNTVAIKLLIQNGADLDLKNQSV